MGSTILFDISDFTEISTYHLFFGNEIL